MSNLSQFPPQIELLVSIPELIAWLLVIAAVVAVAWWSLREEK